MSNHDQPRVGITMGDPLGIGPEVIVKALRDAAPWEVCTPMVIGDLSALSRAAADIADAPRLAAVNAPDQARSVGGVLGVLDLENARDLDWSRREPTAAGGRAAGEAIERAVRLALAGEVHAIATAPISKEAMRLAGYALTGHTELLAHLTGASHSTMMLICGDMRVAHVTTHLALQAVPQAVTRERVLRTIELTADALRRLGAGARIAVAGLNPHAGEAGLFGDEERDAIAPAVEDARRRGLEVTGPVPPDIVFAQHRGGLYDAVIAMYHDQGHIAIKTLAFTPAAGERAARMSGVNVTLGLPIIRTSVDHGTAFDIAGRGIASEQSMKEAILLAARMAAARR